MKKLLTWVGAVALVLLPTIAAAQSGPPVSTRMANGSATDSTPVYNFCSNDSGATWIACPTPSGGGGGGGDASAANQTTQISIETAIQTALGAVTASPTANTIGDRLKTLNSTLGSPYQAGGALPLPSGAATSANQTSANTKLDQLHTDMVAATPAGSNLIGKVGIDQTTPGTTNLVWPLGSRPFVVKGGPIPNTTTAYAANRAIGGLITISTGLPAGTVIASGVVRIKLLNDASTLGAINYIFFDANPTASTLGDNAAVSLASADLPKAIVVAAIGSWTNGGTGQMALITLTIPARLTVDGSGNIYLSLIASGSNTFASANSLYWEADGVD